VRSLDLTDRQIENDGTYTTLYFTRPLELTPANPAPVPSIMLDGTDTMIALAYGE
jgi:hypothetical protein